MQKRLLTEEDKKAIAAAIHTAEGMTSGEIVFGVADASARYRHSNYEGALAGMVVGSAIYLALPINHTLEFLLWTELISFAAAFAIMSHVPWRPWFIASAEMEVRVQHAALTEFYASGLYRTRESNGVLIYLSLFERRVVVLGDRGIHEKMGDPHWHDVRDSILQGIKAGKAREGIISAIEKCGAALAHHFPHADDDQNELSDQVIDRRRNPNES